MVANRKNKQEIFDAFSDAPAAKKKTGTPSCSIGIATETSTSSHGASTDSHSCSNFTKKITGSTRFKHAFDDKKTATHTVTIDTDTANNQPEQLSASIDTDEFLNCNAGMMQDRSPVIIDENDLSSEQERKLRQTGLIKKEKPIQQRCIAIDISSDISSHAMPSAEAKDQLGSGTVTGVLGTGGMACVYKIWNERLEIYRAVKILLPTLNREQQHRFLTEAKISVKLHHPNIIETYDCGEWHGLPTIEMELIDGPALNTLISSHQRIPSPVCASIAVQVAGALAYAHSQELLIYGKTYKGIIHRDLKPSNIMLTQSGRVKLMDFGVARPIETGLHTVVTDSIVGTIHYFSPEQIGGYPIDHLTDIYSFGAVLYELLCGKNPFPYSNMVTMIQAKTKNQFRRLEDFQIEMDQRIASVAQTCLRTDKRERYADFQTLAAVLADIQSSYHMGSPEEVVAEFSKNPDNLTYAYNQHLDRNRQNALQQHKILQPENASSAEAQRTVGQNSESSGKPDRSSKAWIIFAVLLISTLLLAAGGILLLSVTADGPAPLKMIFNSQHTHNYIQKTAHAQK